MYFLHAFAWLSTELDSEPRKLFSPRPAAVCWNLASVPHFLKVSIKSTRTVRLLRNSRQIPRPLSFSLSLPLSIGRRGTQSSLNPTQDSHHSPSPRFAARRPVHASAAANVYLSSRIIGITTSPLHLLEPAFATQPLFDCIFHPGCALLAPANPYTVVSWTRGRA